RLTNRRYHSDVDIASVWRRERVTTIRLGAGYVGEQALGQHGIICFGYCSALSLICQRGQSFGVLDTFWITAAGRSFRHQLNIHQVEPADGGCRSQRRDVVTCSAGGLKV